MRTVASDMMHNVVRRQRAAVDVAWQVHEMTVGEERVLTDLSLAAAGTHTTTFNTDTANTLNLCPAHVVQWSNHLGAMCSRA